MRISAPPAAGLVAVLVALSVIGWGAASPLMNARSALRTPTPSPVANSTLRILYVVRSFPGHYDKVLKDQHDTWMKYLNPSLDKVLIASIAEGHAPVSWANFEYSTPSGCQNNHGEGLCCQEAHSIVRIGRHYEFDWAVFIDDDVYVWPPVMREVVEEANLNPLVSIGVTGCGALGFGGFCGGGGYIVSKQAIDKLSSDEGFMPKYEGNCKLTQYCDITTGWILSAYGISIISDPKVRLHSWGFVTGKNRPTPQERDNEYALLTVKFIEHLQQHRVASLHYRGGEFTDDFETVHSKMMFLHRMFTTVYLTGAM